MQLTRRALLTAITAATLTPAVWGENTSRKRVRIIVSLADNLHQGIVPIPGHIGNGQNPRINHYWGALFGMKTHFKKHDDWTVLAVPPVPSLNPHILDVIHISKRSSPADPYVRAEAWDGAHQGAAIRAFYDDLAAPTSLFDLVVFVGHNALMDLNIAPPALAASDVALNRTRGRKAAVIACESAPYFKPALNQLGITPYVMTAGLMAPEAYVMEGILSAFAENRSASDACNLAAEQYALYQRISMKSAQRIFTH